MLYPGSVVPLAMFSGHFPNFTELGKCLETGKWQNPLNTESVLKQGKRQNPLNTESVWKQGNSKILWTQKMSGNRKMTKSFVCQKKCLTRVTEQPFRCLDVFLFKFVFTSNKAKDNIFCATTKQTEWHGGHWFRETTKSFASAKTWLTRGTNRHWIRKVSRNTKMTKSLEYEKCLETRKWQNPLNTKSV